MGLFPLKWKPQTHGLLRTTSVDLTTVPAVARNQTEQLLLRLDDDAKWVTQPLVHTLADMKFDRKHFEHLLSPGVFRNENMHAEVETAGFSRIGWLDALESLAAKYPLIPSVLWDTVAVMGLRPNPDHEEAIPNLGDLLRHPWSLSDAALHAATKATAFWFDICAELERHSGRYPEHGCGCSHIFRELSQGVALPSMPADRLPHTPREWWEHFLSELALIHVLGFPFALHQNAVVYERTLVPAQ